MWQRKDQYFDTFLFCFYLYHPQSKKVLCAEKIMVIHIGNTALFTTLKSWCLCFCIYLSGWDKEPDLLKPLTALHPYAMTEIDGCLLFDLRLGLLGLRYRVCTLSSGPSPPPSSCYPKTLVLKNMGYRLKGAGGYQQEAVSFTYCESLCLSVHGLCTSCTATQAAVPGRWSLASGGHGWLVTLSAISILGGRQKTNPTIAIHWAAIWTSAIAVCCPPLL